MKPANHLSVCDDPDFVWSAGMPHEQLDSELKSGAGNRSYCVQSSRHIMAIVEVVETLNP